MKSLDRMIKRERNRECREIKRIFKARDVASKYVDTTLRVSMILERMSLDRTRQMSIKQLAKWFIDVTWIRPNPPPPRNTKPSIK